MITEKQVIETANEFLKEWNGDGQKAVDAIERVLLDRYSRLTIVSDIFFQMVRKEILNRNPLPYDHNHNQYSTNRY